MSAHGFTGNNKTERINPKHAVATIEKIKAKESIFQSMFIDY